MVKLAIKPDNRIQNLLFPPPLDAPLDALVPENHMARVVDAVIDRLDISDILSTYRGGGELRVHVQQRHDSMLFP